MQSENSKSDKVEQLQKIGDLTDSGRYYKLKLSEEQRCPIKVTERCLAHLKMWLNGFVCFSVFASY